MPSIREIEYLVEFDRPLETESLRSIIGSCKNSEVAHGFVVLTGGGYELNLAPNLNLSSHYKSNFSKMYFLETHLSNKIDIFHKNTNICYAIITLILNVMKL